MKYTGASTSLMLLALFSFAVTARAEGGAPPETYDQIVVLTRTGQRVEGRQGTLTATSLRYLTSAGPMTIGLDNIKTLYVTDGTLAGSMALVGAASGFSLGLTAFLNSGVSLNSDAAVAAVGLIIGGLTGLGALSGGLVGATIVQWRVEPVITPSKQAGVLVSFAI